MARWWRSVPDCGSIRIFSATKIAWLLEHVDGARAAAEAGALAFGTIDSFLLWRLTGGAVHATDATNAARTVLFDIHRGVWDEDLLAVFGIPRALLPDARDSSGDFGITSAALLGGPIPIRGIAGDQQAALIGQGCFRPGMIKSTYGTGCFALLNTGSEAVASRQRLITTIAYQLDGVRTYALEGSIFVAGAAVQWLRDGLGLIASADETGGLAAAADPAQAVYLVPAFVGLGAPHWDSEAQALLTGMTRGTTRRELARAALECVAYQTRDLVEAMRADLGPGWPGGGGGEGAATVIRVDGGMSASDWTMQFLADILAAPVDRPACLETTARGGRLSGRAGHGTLSRSRRLRRQLDRRTPLRPAYGGLGTRGEISRLAECGETGGVQGVTADGLRRPQGAGLRALPSEPAKGLAAFGNR